MDGNGKNTPSWDEYKEEVSWTAEYVACDKDGSWWFYEKKPYESGSGWNNVVGTKFRLCKIHASPEWAKENWKYSLTSLSDNSAKTAVNKYLVDGPSRHKRVTLFIDYDNEVENDGSLSYTIASLLKTRLNDDALISDGATVDRIRIAVGKNKLNEINYCSDEAEFYIDGEEPEPSDDDDDDDDDDEEAL